MTEYEIASELRSRCSWCRMNECDECEKIRLAAADEIERLQAIIADRNEAIEVFQNVVEKLNERITEVELDLKIEKAYHTNTPYYYELMRQKAEKTGEA